MIKTAVVPNTPTSFVPYNLQRLALIIKAPPGNSGVVYVKIDASATELSSANGYPLSPGEVLPVSVGRGDGRANLFPNALIAMSTNGTDSLHVTEL